MKTKMMIAAVSLATMVACTHDKKLGSGIDLTDMDTTAVAGDDFYQ